MSELRNTELWLMRSGALASIEQLAGGAVKCLIGDDANVDTDNALMRTVLAEIRQIIDRETREEERIDA